MKVNHILLAIALTILAGCGSGQDKEMADSKGHVDSAATEQADIADSDTTTTATGSMSGSNGTGTDTTDMNRQKATRQKAQ